MTAESGAEWTGWTWWTEWSHESLGACVNKIHIANKKNTDLIPCVAGCYTSTHKLQTFIMSTKPAKKRRASNGVSNEVAALNSWVERALRENFETLNAEAQELQEQAAKTFGARHAALEKEIK